MVWAVRHEVLGLHLSCSSVAVVAPVLLLLVGSVPIAVHAVAVFPLVAAKVLLLLLVLVYVAVVSISC